MKLKTSLLALAVVAVGSVSSPAIGAELTKGTKSYQKKDFSAEAAAPQTQDGMSAPEDVANIAPAAGAEDPQTDARKSFKEDMRLPRKN